LKAKSARKLFGTNGVRGIINKNLTPQMVLDLSESIGTFFGQTIDSSKILLGWDGRTSSPMLADIVTSGLVNSGCKVYHAGMAPTPAIQFLTKTQDLNGGVMVTASHNPPEYNGIKVIDKDGIEISPKDELTIENIYFKKKFERKGWNHLGEKLSIQDGLDTYREAIRQKVDEEKISKSKLKIVVDPANGVGSLVTPYLCRELGCEIVTINANIDGNFPGRLPEPRPANLESLCKAVKVSQADLGVAHDGDADRAIFVDEKGQIHWGDKSFALIVEHFLRNNPGEEIVTPVSSSQMIEIIASRNGGKVIWTPVGSPYVSRTMIDKDAKLGGEENGGIFYGPHIPVRDGAMATALMLEIMAFSGEKLSQLIEKLPRYFNIKDKVPCPVNLKSKILKKLESNVKAAKIETTDGLKIWQKDGSWILVRPSGTEPLYRIFAEAETQEKVEALALRYKKLITRIIKNIRRK
jgi:phosphomannomutase/phosphoglucomutase